MQETAASLGREEQGGRIPLGLLISPADLVAHISHQRRAEDGRPASPLVAT